MDDLKIKLNNSIVKSFTFEIGGIDSSGMSTPSSINRARTDLFNVNLDAWLTSTNGYRYILYEYDVNGAFVKQVYLELQTGTYTKLETGKNYRIMAAKADNSEVQVTDLGLISSNIIVTYISKQEDVLKKYSDELHDAIYGLAFRRNLVPALNDLLGNPQWAVGSTNASGEYVSTTKTRITTKESLIAQKNLHISVDSGYRYLIFKKVNGVWNQGSWFTVASVIPENTEYKLMVGKPTDSANVTVDELLPHIAIKIENEVESFLNQVPDSLLSTESKGLSSFVLGSLNTTTGAIQTSYSRITMSERKSFSRQVQIMHDFESFRIGYIIYDSSTSTYGPWSGWLDKPFILEAGVQFQLSIKHTTGESYIVSQPIEQDAIYTNLSMVAQNDYAMKSYVDEAVKGASINTDSDYYEIPAYVKGLTEQYDDFHMNSSTKIQDIYSWYDNMMNTFPNIITREQIGESTTPTGAMAEIDNNVYPIYCYTIKAKPTASKKIVLGGGIHGAGPSGDPIEGVIACAYYIRDVLFNLKRNKFMQYMLDNCIIKIIPVINPWGYQNDSRGNGNGVDLNRNFDINYVPNAASYDNLTSGASAFSENESQAIRDFFTENTDALFFSEIHARMNTTIPGDVRWLSLCCNNDMQQIIVNSSLKMISTYGGARNNGLYTEETVYPSCYSYVTFRKGVPAYEPEFFRSNNQSLDSLDGLWVMLQAVHWYAIQIQMLVEYYCME